MAGSYRILLVDDNLLFADALADILGAESGFAVDVSASAQEARALLNQNRYDLILLDVALPDQDGRSFCRALREANYVMPIIMLTGATGEANTVDGLEAGATDYVTKPFKFGELLARMRAHLRQYEQTEHAAINLGDLIFRPMLKTLETGSGEKVRLTEKETLMLRYLFRAGGAVVPRQELLHEVWGYNENVNTHTLETHIYRLRQKLEPYTGTMLQTEEGGYRLNF